MASMKVASCVVLMCMVVMCSALPIAQADISCGEVVISLAPCQRYLTSGGDPDAGCCGGLSKLVTLAKTTPDRQTACKCLKSAAAILPGYVDQNAVSLPAKCKVNISFKFSTSTDCATIKF